jgi:quercetin dioxygenase-like cupin family protein
MANARRLGLLGLLCFVIGVLVVDTGFAQQPKTTRLKQADLTGTNMEMFVSILEVPPGATIRRHTHKGEEVVQVLEGAMIENYEQTQEMWETGATFINVRDVPHGGYKVIGDKTLKLLTVHVLDKGSPFVTLVK